MDSDLWISRLAAAKRHYSLLLQNQNRQLGFFSLFNSDDSLFVLCGFWGIFLFFFFFFTSILLCRSARIQRFGGGRGDPRRFLVSVLLRRSRFHVAVRPFGGGALPRVQTRREHLKFLIFASFFLIVFRYVS